MTGDTPAVGPEIDTKRLEAFSDGVMAVIITIMAFELRAPNGVDFSALRHRFPALIVYLMSFTFIGIYWNNHHHLFRATPRINAAVMWANLHLLFWLSLIPVATEWVATSYRFEWPATTYGIIAAGSALAYYLLVRAILAANEQRSAIAAAIGNDRKGTISLVAYLAAIALSFASPWIAYAIYVTVALMWLVPDRRLTRSVSGL